MKRIFSLILALMAVQMMFAAPYTVTNTSDDVEEEGSLRWACNQASSNKSVEITFDIEGDGNKVIKLTNQIQIQGNVTIDASSSKDSIIIDANDMEFSDYCFYINNYNSAKLNLKGLVLKNRKTSAIYLSSSDYYENTVDVQIDSCFFYGDITAYGGNLLIKNSSLNHSVIASTSESTYLEIVDCEFVNAQNLSVRLTIDPAKFVCSRTTFSREGTTLLNPIYYVSESKYSTPVIDTAYVRNGKLFVNGHISSNEVVDIELFTSSNASYNSNSSDNRYECKKYFGTTKTNSNGIFSLEMTLPEKGLMLKQHFVLSASATYAKAHTSSFTFYDVKQPYWVVNTTLDEKSGSDFIVGSMRWACHYASANDTIVFDFPGKGKKEIEGFNYSTNASVDGSTYADTIILHGLHCYNVNKIVSENVSDGHGFSIAGGKMTNCISRNNKTGVEIYIEGISVENCIIEKNRDFGIHGSHSFNKIKHTIIRENNIGVSSSSGGKCIEECDIINNIIGISSTSHPSILDSVISCWISGNDSVGMYGSRIIYGNNIGLDRNQKTAMPNGYGIIASPYTDVIKNNIVAGNNRCGVLASEKNSLDSISENFIGTNRNLDIDPILGNGEDGLRGPGGALGHMPSISNCYFMNNHGSGINAMLEGTVSSCVFSNNSENGAIFTDFIGLPRFKQCSFSDNKQGGLVLLGQSDIIDIDSCEFSRNENYGLSMSQCNFDLTNSTFDSNKGTAFVYDITKYNATTSLLSDNKFLNTVRPNPAFKTTNPYPVPEFTSCKMTEKTIEIVVKVDTAAKAKIELFYTSQGKQTAEALVDSFYTNADGTFSVSLDRSQFAGKSIIGFTATATYGKITSPLSDVVYPEAEKIDLTRTEFYVKTDGYGDGSSWENAMSPYTFAYYLPQVKDGSTFHVAEGRYLPVDEDKNGYREFKINSSVSIIGGYPTTAKTGAASDPKHYKTIFTGDPSGDDSYIDDDLAYDRDVNDPNKDDINVQSLFNAEATSEIYFYGCGLVGSTAQQNGRRFATTPIVGNLIKLERCELDMVGTIWAKDGTKVSKLEASECIFRSRSSCSSPSSIFSLDTLKVEKSLFEGMKGGTGGCFSRVNKAIFIENSTFTDIISSSSLYEGGKLAALHLLNNTFNNLTESGSYNSYFAQNGKSADLKIIGNIFVNCSYSAVIDEVLDNCEVRDNLCSGNTVGTDLDLKTEYIDDVLEWRRGAPVLKDNGGFTPTMALKRDNLIEGASIRFPRLDNIITDQRGESRPLKTCMGAYEFGCPEDTTMIADTIEVGSKFAIDGKLYDKIGIYKDILSKHTSQIGCDSVVNHTLFVVPSAKIKEYYVKTSKAGKGDGSSWDNAMDSKDFAYVFENLQTDGVTFYIAAGTYYAVYNGGGKETNDKVSHWSSRHGANIYGGYDPKSTGDASTTKANPVLYRTIFTGDINGDDHVKIDSDCGYTLENFTDNMTTSMLTMELYSDVHISGIEFTGMSYARGTSPSLILLYAKDGNKYKVTIDHCKLNVADKGISISNVSNVMIDNCEFEYIRNSAIYSDKTCTVSNSTFAHTNGVSYNGNNSELNVKNSTFVKNRSDLQVSNYSNFPSVSANIYNNTFISCDDGSYIYVYDNVTASVEGNIFAGPMIEVLNSRYDTKKQSFTNNLFACKSLSLGETTTEKNNIKLEDATSLYNGILKGTYSAADAIFTPELTDKGAFTRTVALLDDKLEDGTPIRFPRLENVLTDQRGVSRLDETCMGAYEFGCVNDTTDAVDTIVVGEKFVDGNVYGVGRHDSIFMTYKTAQDCDSVVNYTLFVTPDPSALNYYVKTKKAGKGDGSDWDNAMDGDDFSAALPLAPEGAIFYVAAGTYTPKYDAYLTIPEDSSILCYTIKNDVTIRGGYPAGATGKDVPSDPAKYKTIFTGDIKGDDVINETLDEDGYPNLERTNGEDNARCIFNVGMYGQSNANHITLDGVVCQNATQYVLYSNNNTSLDLVNVEFEKNLGYNVIYGCGDVNLQNSLMSKNLAYNGFIYSSGKKINVTNTTFESNVCNSSFISIPNENVFVKFDSVHYLNNKIPRVVEGMGNEVEISNSHFSGNYSYSSTYFNNLKQIDSHDNVFEKNTADLERGIYLSLGNITLKNDFFISNSTGFIIKSSGDLNIANSVFSDNKLKSVDCIVHGNNVVVVDSKFKENERNGVSEISAIYADGTCVAIRDTIENNSMGGLFRTKELKLDSCIVRNNNSQIVYFDNTNGYTRLNECDSIVNSTFEGNVGVHAAGRDSSLFVIRVANLVVNKNTFIGNRSKMDMMRLRGGDNITISECLFSENKVSNLLSVQKSNSDNFTFEKNTLSRNVLSAQLLSYVGGNDFVRNNTIVLNESGSDLIMLYTPTSSIDYKKEVHNNTIIGNDIEGGIFNAQTNFNSFYGNLIFGNIYDKKSCISPVSDNIFKYNITPIFRTKNGDDEASFVNYDNTNIISDYYLNSGVKADDISYLFEGKYNSETGLFTPVLANNGGFTPTVALKSDKLSDGTSIRFPRLENVLTDQRGVERLDETCMGAYEMRCTPIITELKDTVVVGDSYTFNEKNLDDVCQKVGSYYFSDTLAGAENCDSIVKLSLAVRPQKNENGYYVKVDGTGDGSDWDHAMSPKDFAEYLPLVYDGETFHIAAGTYKSTYEDPELGRMYNVNSSVTLIGGYPDTVTSVATPSMPDVFVTKLTADVRGNDYTYYYPNSLDLVPYSNFKDNDSILIRVNGEKTLTLYGMTLSGVNSCDKGTVDLAEGSSLVMDRCFVQNNVASGVYGKGVDVKVTNSVFTHNYSNNGTAFNLTDSKLNVQSSAVYENMANIAGCDVEYSKGGVASLDNTEATFENSTLSNNAADMGSAFCVKSAKLELINNTIVGNQTIPTSKYKGSVIGSLDDKSSVSLFGNIMIGNQPNEFDGVIGVNSSDYNVFSFKTDMPYGEHDMIMNDPKEVQMLLDGEMVYNSEVVFIPNVQYNGGYTPTVAVIQSAFDGGKILNIPLDDRKVTYDQRGFVRKDSSCIGAFEFPTFMGYYVKKQTHGDGSGRDWENSMNDTTFAKYFPIVPTNASFHIAEGVYSPMYDTYGKLTDSKSRRYSSSRLVNIYGGYPDSAQTGCEADPIKYKTVFSVDYDGDDKYVESESGYSYVEALNTLDNGYSIVNILSKIPGWIEINGVEFRGQRCVPRASSTAVQIAGFNTVGVNAKIEKCSFIGNYSGLYAACDSIVINECLVDSTSAYGLSLSSFSTNKNNFLLIDKSTIANTQYPTTTYSFRGQMRVQNSTFANVVFGLSTPGDYMVSPENTKVEIYNNSIFSGKKGDYGLYMYDFLPIDLKGNIIASDKVYVTSDPNRKHESMPIVSDYNVYTTSEDLLKLGENDTIVPQSSIAEVVKGTMENGKFEAAVEDQEIYVKIPTLINVKFNEGGGIKRMPENATPVTEDQTGESRPAADYCIGALEADCEFKKANFKLELAEEVICRDDTAIVTLTGLTKKEKETYKFAWTSSKDSVYVVDTFANPGKFHVYARQATVPLQMTITNICGVDTVLEIVQNVNGVGSVPFDGVEEGEVFCQNAAEPVKLTTAVDGAIFTGECVVKKSDGYYFDATKAKGDSTRVRCSIQDGDCRSFDEKTIQFFKFEGDTLVEIASSTQTKNVCMEKPQAQSVFTVKGWREGLTCKLNGLPSTLSDSTVTKDSVLTVTYASLKNGEYIFEVSDECKPIASETIKIENEEIDPDMLKLSLDTVVANTQTCDGGEFGDVRVEYSGNINNADVVIVLSSNGTLIKSDTLSEENAFVVFDNLKPAVYDAKIFFDGMEDCTTGDANYSRTVDVTKPVKFEVAFTATQAICENSIDAMMLTKTSGGNTPYTYKWTKYVGDIATSTVSHTKTLHDTLPDLVKNEVYLCDVVDNYGCAASSDTLKIIYDHADSTMVDTFIYDPYQRCKGKNNAQMIVDFSVVSDYAHPVYTLEKLNEDNKYAELDVKDNASALNKILLDNLAPGKYKLHVGYPSVGCPSLVDTMVEIKELVNEFKFEAADSIRMPHCYANNDAAIYFHAIGASRGLTATFSYKKSEKTLYNLTIDSLAGDTAYFVADNLPNDSFVVKMKNVCGDEITYEYKVGAPGFGIEKIDSLSFKTLKCRYDSTGITAFRIHTGDNDSAKVTLRYSKQVETIFYYKDTTYTTVEVPIYRMEPRVKDTIWNADSTEYDVRYERDPITNEIIVDTIVTYETRDTMIIETKNRVGYRNVDAEFPCKFDTVYGKDTVFIYSGLPGGIYFIDLVSTINGCKDSLRTLDTINIPNPVSLNYQVLDVSCKSKTDGVISLKPVRSGGGDRTFVLKHDSTFKDGKYEYEMCYIGYTADGETTVNNLGMEVKKKVFVNYYYGDYPLMTRLNRISNKSELYKKDGDKYIQIQGYEIDAIENNLKRYIFGNEWKSIRWTKKDATGHFLDFTIVTPDSTTYEEDVYYSGPDIIKTAVWSYTHLSNFWKDEYGEWLASGVQTIANLPKGVYNCVVTDTNDCVYSTNITVSEPKEPLTIVEVTYDAVGALCDPTKRHIDMKVKGGWGDYNYMVMDGKPVEGNGGLIDNYLGATSITYDTVHAMGVYRSQFLDPGKYRVAVVDGKGCRIEFDDDFEVKTNFTVEGSVEDALCPGEESAPATFVIHDPEKSEGYKYAVKEHIGSCDTPYDCVDDLNFVDCKVDFVDDGMTFTKKITGGGHGFFIYRLDTNGDTTCGTYVRVSAVDTLKPMTLSKKSITHVTCNGSANGEIELYVLGGKAPYIVDVNPSWGSDVIEQRIENLYPEVDPTDTMGKFPRIIIKNLKARDYYFTITDSNKCHQRFGDTAIHTAKLTVKEPDALTAEFGASSMCANAGAADDPNYGSVFAQDVKGGTAPYLFSVTGGLEVKRELDGGNVEYYHESVDSDDPFIPVAGYKETEFHYTIEDSMGCQISKTLMFGQEEIKSVRQKEFLATTWSHYGDVIALIDFCGPESTFDSVSYKFSNEKVKMLDKRLYIYDLDNPKRGATPNAKNIVLSYHDTREVPDGFFIENFNMVKDMTPLLAAHINFVAVTDKSDLYKSTNHAANDSLCLKTDVVMSSYFKGCRYQVEIKDFLKVAYDNVELYYGGVDKRKNILDIVVNPNPRTEDKPCIVNVYFADNTEDCVLSFYHMDGSEIDRVTIHAGDLKVTKYDHDKAYVYTYNVEDDRFNNVEVVVISAMTNHDSKGSFLLNASSVGQ